METMVNVWAIDYTQTQRSHVSNQGFGSSSKLDTPEPTRTTFCWSASWPKDDKDVSGASNGNEELTILAGNLAANYLRFPRSESEPVQFTNGPTDEAKEHASRVGDGTATARPLTFREMMKLCYAFQEVETEAELVS